ncbi:MAG TPA: hypothetical protein VFE08_16815 [Candidatus Sulfotelmatobacter sp.]|nr:hypothetical protein [Candidatus Sulfotelmatobacter sp.]
MTYITAFLRRNPSSFVMLSGENRPQDDSLESKHPYLTYDTPRAAKLLRLHHG